MTPRSRTVLPLALSGVLAVTALHTAGSSTPEHDAAPPPRAASSGGADAEYDLLIDDGHVIDPKNERDEVLDVAIDDGVIAEVAAEIDPTSAERTVDASGLYVTPGLIDMHTHLFVGPNDAYSAGWQSVAPDGFTFRSGVTTAVDTGSAGWENFDEFKTNVIDRSNTRVLAFLNIVGKGMAGGEFEQDLTNMLPGPAARVAQQYPDDIVGIKTAHYEGTDWKPVERSVRAGEIAGLPVMVDFGADHPERPLEQLLTEKLRPGDIYSHAYSGNRGELTEDGKVNPGMWAGRERGVLFDVGHGGGSFAWDVAVPAMEEGFVPDTISTDLHISSMNSGMKDMTNVMSKFLALGLPLYDVIEASTLAPAQAIGREDLGHLSPGAPADVALLELAEGDFGLVDSFGFRIDGDRKLVCALTVRAGEVVWDLDGRAAKPWMPREQ
ncbi:amidohydrolase/deacetylase family metallohydrolase [Jiangella asiatica]|uniref:Amidohydrolase/deacetylase family metallohydrolase n=1 Tax=Jiangella asiatica TaxID=2530372 RepID=A0A4R5D3H8_9ACTN|nr:amidohydrolase/deacetylase family metallohydrolase [Jiangella asiatica]TDE07919.1 amidohydrolase/deacetylase family metallohydrolase [Jiangella asiatica]